MKYCVKCGAELKDNINFCTKCGYKVNEDKPFENKEEVNIEKQDTNIKLPITNEFKKNNKIPKIIAGAALVVLCVLAAVFFNRIQSYYYCSKCNNEIDESKKIDYAAKALKALENDDNKELLKNTLLDVSKNDLNLAEDKLNKLSSMLNKSDIDSILIDIKEKKVDNYCSKSKYEDALVEYGELNKLDVDIKKDKHYDDVMLNVISKIMDVSVKKNKEDLLEDCNICYENLDSDDVFDEIIEVKDSGKHSNYNLKVNLYKFDGNKYRQVDSKTIDNGYNEELQGIYNYADSKKGLFVNYSDLTSHATAVFAIDNGKLSLKGTVYGNNYTKADDKDNDNIYEVVSSNKNYINSRYEEAKKWYSISEDGNNPKEVGSSGEGDGASDYILPDSDSRNLTESEVKSLSKDRLALARNEIFARHGYVFKEEPFKSYFEGKSWYVKNSDYDGNDGALNNYEIFNYKLIQEWENK